MERLVGSRTLQRLKNQVLPAGLRDMQEWTDVSLTFRRRSGTGWVDVNTTTIRAISIHLGGNQPMEAMGAVETSTRGAAKVFAADVADTPVREQDRFTWDGHVCVVDLVAPTRLGVHVTIEFTLLEGN